MCPREMNLPLLPAIPPNSTMQDPLLTLPEQCHIMSLYNREMEENMKRRDYKPGTKIEVKIDGEWAEGVVQDNLSIQYFIRFGHNMERGVWLFKASGDLMREAK